MVITRSAKNGVAENAADLRLGGVTDGGEVHDARLGIMQGFVVSRS
jgi:hypothetical protein